MMKEALDDCDCDAAHGNAIQCECESRVNKPNEKDNASARLTLLQVLGLICPTAGLPHMSRADAPGPVHGMEF